jgi:hypothetical protein
VGVNHQKIGRGRGEGKGEAKATLVGWRWLGRRKPIRQREGGSSLVIDVQDSHPELDTTGA